MNFRVFVFLLATVVSLRAADVDISMLPANLTPAAGTLIEVFDTTKTPKTGKVVLLDYVNALLSNYQPLDGDLTDLADGSLTGSKVGPGIDDDNVDFDDADNLWTATTIGAALEEMNNSINAGAPNGTGAKVHWSQLLGVPAGFADGTDDGGGGGTSGTMINTGASTVSAVPRYTDTTGTNLAPSSVTIDANGLMALDSADSITIGSSVLQSSGLIRGTSSYGANAVASGSVTSHTGTYQFGNPVDTFLIREADNILAIRDGANAQLFHVYNTFTDASNYERASFGWSGNLFTIGTAAAGTGSGRSMILNGASQLIFTTGSTERFRISNSGHLIAGADNTYDIGASGATRPRTIYVGTDLRAGNSMFVDSVFGHRTGTLLSGGVNGNLRLTDNAGTSFGLLQFGGTTASFPSLKRSTTGLIVRLADDSADAPITASTVTASTSMTLGGVTRTSWPSGAATNSFPLNIKPTFLPASNAAREDSGADNFRLRFAQNQAAIWQFALPRNYNGGMHIDLTWEMDTATSGSVTWSVEVWALSAGDAADNGTQSFDTANTASTAVPGVAGRPGITTVTCTNADSAAALDFVQLRLTRTDAVSGDADLTGILFNHAMP